LKTFAHPILKRGMEENANLKEQETPEFGEVGVGIQNGMTSVDLHSPSQGQSVSLRGLLQKRTPSQGTKKTGRTRGNLSARTVRVRLVGGNGEWGGPSTIPALKAADKKTNCGEGSLL